MIEIERLSWTVTIFVFVWLASQCFRLYQRRGLRAVQNLPTSGQASLMVIVSSRCAICPAQKKAIAQLCALYPLLLRVVVIDADTQSAQARALSVMTVPSTLLQAPDGRIVEVNHGFIALKPLVGQVNKLLRRASR